ncbi:hypothetical protein ACUXAV_005026 [Cupriavidus metallidurans]|jgi:hypothetical protein|uniref:hypothetical protein n=1 Tax=Cupriavidus TaxID=106589 RepID=UPI001269C552|nr:MULTISPECIES: hypothetical protein [Cupriavidus]MCA3184857.1 hypothetical protein [Cupriavidus sp.]MCA3192211.1 hypothetical protein [Cupriavidus sp.]MDE4922594.1 hypothetical protein [Cupriavidus metallidurans]
MMNYHRWICTLLLALAGVWVAGCTQSAPVEQVSVFERAKAESDGNKAIEILEAELGRTDPDTTSICGFPRICGDAFRAYRRDLYVALDARAAELAPVLATDQLLSYVRTYEMKASREAVAAQIVERAKKAEGKPGDVPLLDDAASLLAEGRSVLRNRDVAVAFFERSWLAGSTYAAKGLADLYLKSGDLDNAYLWSVRNKTPGVVWTSRIEGLSTEAIHNAEAVASNKSILSMRADKAGGPRT